jgi:hypothetical protein
MRGNPAPITKDRNMIKAHNLTSPQGNKVPNQIVITGDGSETFQSYGTTIAIKNGKGVELDRKFWNYGYRRTIKKGLTLEQAQAHCRDPKTSSSYTNKDGAEAPGQWFDGYEEE